MNRRHSRNAVRAACGIVGVGLGLVLVGRPTWAQEVRPLRFEGARGDFLVIDSLSSVLVSGDSAYRAEADRCARVIGIAEGDIRRLQMVTPLEVPRGAGDSTAGYVSFFTSPRVVEPSGCVEGTVKHFIAPLRGVRFTGDTTTRPWFQPVGMALIRGDTVMYGQVVATAPSWRAVPFRLVREPVGLVRTSVPLDSLAPTDSGFSPSLALAVFYGYDDAATVERIPESVLRALWRRALRPRLELATARPAVAGIPPMEMPRAWNGRLRDAQSRAASGEYGASVTGAVDVLESRWRLSRRDRHRAHLLLADIAFRHADTNVARVELLEAQRIRCYTLPDGASQGFVNLARPIALRDWRCRPRSYVVAGLRGGIKPGFGTLGMPRSPLVGVALTTAIVLSAVHTVELNGEARDLRTRYITMTPLDQDSAAAAAAVETAYQQAERARLRVVSSARVTAGLWVVGVLDALVDEMRRRHIRKTWQGGPAGNRDGEVAAEREGPRLVLAPDRIGLRWEFR